MNMRFQPTPLTVLRRGCPRCGRPMFGGLFTMHERCPGCRLLFDRGEPGYYTGAMSLASVFSFPLVVFLLAVVHLLFPRWSLTAAASAATALCVALTPWIWQFSRTIWIHLDQSVDPVSRDYRGPHSRRRRG
ncbi:hypothetical protein OJF2_54280 [Aquisphaera giovannonii]|uniref:DUF983 domain-containing protein n=1 Tax=Aquisphaera giovannonii TaxID=406548 RepID=A0A5B9W8E4_9BACT|nr:DUF983 domain-containing protein [Aquisphaera giovannonii]QEH36843.1 hypothetical protein OJF2_54280 [Aquisphaera giovannonii]